MKQKITGKCPICGMPTYDGNTYDCVKCQSVGEKENDSENDSPAMKNPMKGTKTTTCHFVNKERAIRYYQEQECLASTDRKGAIKIVNQKLAEGLIYLGKPTIQKGQKLYVNFEGRYTIGE